MTKRLNEDKLEVKMKICAFRIILWIFVRIHIKLYAFIFLKIC